MKKKHIVFIIIAVVVVSLIIVRFTALKEYHVVINRTDREVIIHGSWNDDVSVYTNRHGIEFTQAEYYDILRQLNYDLDAVDDMTQKNN